MSLGETAAALAKDDPIQKYGTTIVLKHRTSVYDPDTGINTVSEASVTTIAAIDKVDYNLMDSLGKNNNDTTGETIQIVIAVVKVRKKNF